MSANIKEIAQRANVSPATVSRVFSGSAGVRDETRAVILSVAAEMGYSPRKTGRPASTSTSEDKMVALLIPGLRSAYYSEILSGIESVFRPLGIRLLFCSMEDDPIKELEYLKSLYEMKISGVILVPTFGILEETVSLLNTMDSSGSPVCLLDRDLRSATFDGVFMDNYSGVFHCTNALIKFGHKNIAFLRGDPTADGAISGARGYREALETNTISFNGKYYIWGHYEFDGAYRAVLASLPGLPEVTAIVAQSQRMALGCVFALSQLGLKAGEDVALMCCGRPDMGFDTISHASYPSIDVGRECAKILFSRMSYATDSGGAHRRVFYDMKLYFRGSEKCNRISFGK